MEKELRGSKLCVFWIFSLVHLVLGGYLRWGKIKKRKETDSLHWSESYIQLHAHAKYQIVRNTSNIS